jgi:alkylation response protein AidB-like acyl-CoA dehydrogenase
VSSHDDVLADLLSGEQVAGWCYLEPGRPLGKVATNVRLEGERVVLSGAKAPVEAAGVAGHLLVVAAGDEGLTEVLVPAGTPGVTVAPRQGIDLVRRFATVTFDEVDLPATALVGQPGGAGYQVERQLQVATVLTLAETLGALAAVFEFTTQWAFDRYSFGRPLASYQELKHRFADMALWLEASRATTAAAARAVQDDAVEAAELVSVAASYVGEHAGELVQDCVQMHGGIGVTWDHDIHLYLRRVTLNAAVYGTVADHRRRLAALVGLV